MKPVERPWRLEVWEMDPDIAEETWRTWSTYVTEDNANERRDKLNGKGYTARVTHTGQAEAVLEECVLCGEPHEGPFDGSCLI